MSRYEPGSRPKEIPPALRKHQARTRERSRRLVAELIARMVADGDADPSWKNLEQAIRRAEADVANRLRGREEKVERDFPSISTLHAKHCKDLIAEARAAWDARHRRNSTRRLPVGRVERGTDHAEAAGLRDRADYLERQVAEIGTKLLEAEETIGRLLLGVRNSRRPAPPEMPALVKLGEETPR